MSILKEYIEACGDKAIIQINDDKNIPMGYYAGSIIPYCSCWEKAKFYKTKASAFSIAKKVLENKFTIIMISSLI